MKNVPAERQCLCLITLFVVAHAADLRLASRYATLGVIL